MINSEFNIERVFKIKISGNYRLCVKTRNLNPASDTRKQQFTGERICHVFYLQLICIPSKLSLIPLMRKGNSYICFIQINK